MRIAHRTPASNWFSIPASATVDADYEAEVRHATDNGEREYQRRAQRLARAEARLVRAHAANAKRRRLAELQAAVELRRAELDEYRRLMVSIPASVQHRGAGSYRPVPLVHGNPIP